MLIPEKPVVKKLYARDAQQALYLQLDFQQKVLWNI